MWLASHCFQFTKQIKSHPDANKFQQPATNCVPYVEAWHSIGLRHVLTSLAQEASVSSGSSSYSISTVLFLSFTVFKHAQYNRLSNTQFHTPQHLFFQNFYLKYQSYKEHTFTQHYRDSLYDNHFVSRCVLVYLQSDEFGRQSTIIDKNIKEVGGDMKQPRNVTEEEPLLERTRHMQNTGLLLDLV
jgi:hypothetical protein